MDRGRPGDDELRRRLTSLQYDVTQRGGTEAPFSGRYCHYDGAGMYRCICCGAGLFDAATQFDSGSGWPSFWQPAAPGLVELIPDSSGGRRRVEVRCGRCGAHLGHVFDDGPQPTGTRYCINSAALDFEAEGRR
ncbi:MAG: peptide-methionine (R)-S-oxide reductase MsrB [Gammaproteobacteria bacterium]|nr:peptide-methionine (R)-S-oxide reductase MsrB [Gammaproteobacteria bacterium]